MTRILIIDDEAPVRELLRQTLEREGYEVDVAPEGRAGLSVLREAGADLLVTDIFMPGMEGIETIRTVGREFPGLRILAISGGGRSGNLDYLAMAERIGAHASLAKPFERRELLARVEGLLGN